MDANELPLQRLYRWERERADRTFLSQPHDGGKLREWTWREAAREIRRIAGYLKAQPWEPGSHIAILSRNSAWWLMADLAIWMAGHVSVPIYPSLRVQTVRYILEHSDSKACFIGPTDEREAALEGIPPGVAPIRFPNAPPGSGPDWAGILATASPIESNPTRAPDELATIFYTSGTTGVPKGVMHSFSALCFTTWTLARRLELAPGDRALSYLPLAHIVERTGLEVPGLTFGWHFFFTEGPESFLTDLRRAHPTAPFLSVPRLLVKFQQGVFEKVPRRKLERLMRIPVVRRLVGKKVLRELGLDAVRYAACGAAPLPPELLRWYRRLGLNLLEGYGLTECLITHLAPPGQVRPGYVGTALDGVQVKLGEHNELLMKSPMNMLGYYRDPQATRDAFTADGFFRTGDVVEIDSDGQLKIVGRLKEQFKTSKGKYVVPAPIEIRLLSHPDLESCCLMGMGMQSPFAVAVLSPESRQRCADPKERQALEDSLGSQLDQVNAELDPHERLAFIAVVDGPWSVGNGLMTPTLKLKRGALERQYSAFVEQWKNQERRVVWEAAARPKEAGGSHAA